MRNDVYVSDGFSLHSFGGTRINIPAPEPKKNKDTYKQDQRSTNGEGQYTAGIKPRVRRYRQVDT